MKKIILGLVLFVNVVAFADGPTQVVDFPEELSLVLVHPHFTGALEKAKSSLADGEELALKSASVTEMPFAVVNVLISIAKRTHQLRQGGNRTTREVHLGAIVGRLEKASDGVFKEVSVFFQPAAEPAEDK